MYLSQDKDEVTIKLNFTKPYDIQLNLEADKLRIEILNKTTSDKLLVSKEHGVPLHEDYFNMSRSIPRQTIDTKTARTAVDTAEIGGISSKVLFFIALSLSFFLGGAADFMMQFVRTMQLAFHLPMLRLVFHSLPLMVISEMIPFVMFDFLSNPWDYDITSMVQFEEYPSEEIDAIITTQEQVIGYETTNYSPAMQSILLVIVFALLKLLAICILEILIRVTEDNKSYKETQ